MELFIWVWAWDKRLLCGLNYGKQGVVYMWIFPAIVAASILCFAILGQVLSDNEEIEQCLLYDDELKASKGKLDQMMLIQEGILISVFFASLLTMIVADRIYKNHQAAKIELEQQRGVIQLDKKESKEMAF